MTDRVVAWVVGALGFLFIAGIAQAQFKISDAERDAIREGTRADVAEHAQDVAESIAAETLAAYDDLVTVTVAVQDSLSDEREARQNDRREASATFDALVASVPDTATMVARAVFDSVVVESRNKDAAHERIIATMDTRFAQERTMRLGAEAGWAHERGASELARLEAEAWKNTADSWQRAARPSWILQIKQNVGLVLASGAIAVAGWEAIR